MEQLRSEKLSTDRIRYVIETRIRPMLAAPPSYAALHAKVSEALGPGRRPILIGLDGRNGHGKTSTASWLAWQFGMSSIYLDLFIEEQKSEGGAICKWRTDDLARCIKSCEAKQKPLVIEGVLLLDVLSAIQKTPDFLVVVEKSDPLRSRDRSQDDDLIDRREFSLSYQITKYFERRRPSDIADFKLMWTE